MKPPSLLIFGAADYEVKVKARLDIPALLGETDNENTTILIRRKQSAASMRDTVLHESLHAIIWLSGLVQDVDSEEEERIVRHLAPWLLAALRDNPELVQFLLES